MIANRVYFRGNRAEAVAQIQNLVGALTGKPNVEQADAAKQVHTAIGLAALADIKNDFVRKSRGQVGEDGVQWPKLSPKTLAYSRRFGDSEKSDLKKAAGLGRANRYGIGANSGLLTAAQKKRWKMIFATRLARLAATMGIEAAKGRAAQIAWATLKREGAKTKLDVFGNRQVDILRDTGVLLNSLSPGILWTQLGGEYDPPIHQIFELTQSGVIVGTNVPYASAHQHGTDSIPARPFLPVGKAPEVWVRRWIAAGLRAVTVAIQTALGRAA